METKHNDNQIHLKINNYKFHHFIYEQKKKKK